MRRSWWLLAVAGGLVFLYFTALPGDLPAGRDDDVGLAGTYTVNGVDPTALEYSGTVVIVATDDPDVYELEWIVTGAIHRGAGEVVGTRLIVDWRSIASAVDGDVGRTVYSIGTDGRLTGERTIDGVVGVGVEELIPEP